MKIMIVDDHDGVRRMIRFLLARPADEVRECENADEAVRVASEFKPDFVTMDVRMPGMCSFEATRAIRAAHPGARVVMVSSYDKADFRKAASEAGAEAYVVKDDLAVLPLMLSRPPPAKG